MFTTIFVDTSEKRFQSVLSLFRLIFYGTVFRGNVGWQPVKRCRTRWMPKAQNRGCCGAIWGWFRPSNLRLLSEMMHFGSSIHRHRCHSNVPSSSLSETLTYPWWNSSYPMPYPQLLYILWRLSIDLEGGQNHSFTKKSNPTYFSEHRPIAILRFLSKVLEHLVHNQLSAFLGRNSLLNPSNPVSRYSQHHHYFNQRYWRHKIRHGEGRLDVTLLTRL